MNLLKPFEFIPGVKWFESEMHDSLFQHSVFAAIVFLIISHTDVYKFVGGIISVQNKNLLMLLHAVIFAVIMYFGSMYLFTPLLVEGASEDQDQEAHGNLRTGGAAAGAVRRAARAANPQNEGEATGAPNVFTDDNHYEGGVSSSPAPLPPLPPHPR